MIAAQHPLVACVQTLSLVQTIPEHAGYPVGDVTKNPGQKEPAAAEPRVVYFGIDNSIITLWRGYLYPVIIIILQ